MKRFLNTEFFRMVRETAQTGVVANEDAMKREYDNFAALLLTDVNANSRNALIYVHTELSELTANKKNDGRSLSPQSPVTCQKTDRMG